MTESRRVAFVVLASSASSFVLYVVLAAREVMFGDGPELTAAAVTDGVAHPPGYSLWVILGHIASLFPVGPLQRQRTRRRTRSTRLSTSQTRRRRQPRRRNRLRYAGKPKSRQRLV
jgi:hypothetical protein